MGQGDRHIVPKCMPMKVKRSGFIKFTNGYWQMREGLKAFFPTEAYDVEEGNGILTIYATSKLIKWRRDTLNCPLFTIEFSSPIEDVIRVRLYHHKGVVENSPSFDIYEKEGIVLTTSNNDKAATLISGRLTVKVSKENSWGIEFLNGQEFIIGSGFKNMGYIVMDDGTTYMHEQLSLGVGNMSMGLGKDLLPS